MKKILLSLSAIYLAGSVANAQVIYSEDFEGADPLASMTTYGTDGAVIATNATLNATGLVDDTFWVVGDEPGSNSAMTTTWFSPALDADNYLVTPMISLPAGEAYKLSWTAESLGSSSFLDPYEVKISTTGNAKADFTTTLFSNAAGAPNGAGETIEFYMPGEYAGEDVYIAFVATGNDDYILTFDNISVEQIPGNDIELVSVNLEEFVAAGEVVISGTVKNLGASDITSFDIDWNDGTSHSETFTTTIATGETYDFTHATTLTAEGGSDYSVEVCAILASDEVADNNCSTHEFSAALDVADRLPLLELFTSSTCPPCYSLNYLAYDGSGLNAGLEAENANSPTDAGIAVVKYQVNWPGAGDHAYNNDVAARVSYYSITGAPTPVLDGSAVGAFSYNSAVTNAAKDVPAYFDIEATHSSTDGVVSVNVAVDPYISVAGARLFIALLDKSYDAGSDGSFSNGETEFHHVLRKLMPSATGAVVSFTAGEEYTTTETYDYTFNAGFPPQGSFDLHAASEQEIVVFIQDADGNILNSAISTGDIVGLEENEADNFGFVMFPNPAVESVALNVNIAEANSVNIEIYNSIGELVYSQTENNAAQGAHTYTIGLENFSAGIYNVKTTVGNSVKTKKLSVQ